MSSIVVRGLDESVKKRLAVQAREHGRSMEAEARDILTKAARPPHIGLALLRAAQQAGMSAMNPELVLPERVPNDTARSADFG